MAFTDAQKNDIRGYLGYALGYYQYNTPLESMMDKVGVSPSEQAKVEGILTELATIDSVLASAGSSAAATGMLKQVDEVQFYNATESAGYIAPGAVQRGRMLIKRLAVALGDREGDMIQSDYFGSGTRSNSFSLRMG
jgi:hypothetical protein